MHVERSTCASGWTNLGQTARPRAVLTPVNVAFLMLVIHLVAPRMGAAEAPQSVVRIGLTPVFLEDQSTLLRSWREYLERELQAPVKFVQRQTYREITDLLLQDQLDAAWICGYPYVRYPQLKRLLAVPLFGGKPLYQSYLIVPADDHETMDLTDLEDKVFAYSDPDSNSGYLVPQVELHKAGLEPERFFAKTFFTWAHRDVVAAVADGVAQGGAVDGYVWETLNKTEPELTNRTRVTRKSQTFGFPPFVASASLSPQRFRLIQDVLLEMKHDPEGQRLLRQLNLDGFTPGDERLFDGIRNAMLYLDGEG